MQMPETPLTPSDMDMRKGFTMSASSYSRRQTPMDESDALLSPISKKRERTEEYFHPGPSLKRMFTMTETEIIDTYYADEKAHLMNGATVAITETIPSTKAWSETETDIGEPKHSPVITSGMISPTHRRILTRDFIRSLVNDALRNGHPTSETHKETDLGEIIEVKTVGSRGEMQDRTIFLEIESDVPEVIIAEEQHLQFALQKLVDNAIKFTERGRITITVKLGRGSQVVEIWVVDTGCGIAEESKTNLFKPHFQEDASISRSRDGLGLSLFNAKAHVRKNLGGDVTLERSDTEGPSKGSEFLIRLPITTLDISNLDTALVGTPPPTFIQHRPSPTADSVMASAPISLERGPASTSVPPPPKSPKPAPRKRVPFNPHLAQEYPLNILIAEDNAINRNVAIGSLNKLGYSNQNITLAFDGVEAVNHYKASLSLPPAKHFDAILMDIWMPNMDGYEATKTIMDIAKAHGETTKIIAVTADITEDSVDRAKAAGMQDFLAKPYKVLDIEHLIIDNFNKCC
jgi:CheY-like chemotaxis protein/anti-sigma regulatory factor (Ser/Thr protein kinase)